MLKIGCHLSISKGYFEASKMITSLGGNCYQYFSRNPRGGAMRALDMEDIDNCISYNKEHGITMLCHAPYTLNASSKDEGIRDFARKVFKEDIELLEKFPNALYNFHPGSHTGQGVEIAVDEISEILNECLYKEMTTTILLETMSGKGSEVGRNFEEIKAIMDKVELSDKLGVCLDTCHVYSAGYDIVNDLDKVLDEFDRVIGLSKLKAIHLNDSMMPFASNKDRHEKIGKGSLGLTAIVNIINNERLRDLPFFLETPNEEEGYKEEIAILKASYK